MTPSIEELKEDIRYLQEEIDSCGCEQLGGQCSCCERKQRIIDFLTLAIESKGMPKRKKCHNHDTPKAGQVMLYPCEICEHNFIFNQALDVCFPYVTKLEARVCELESLNEG